jgi:hypothetical protein
MIEKAKHIAAAAGAIAVFQDRCGAVEEHAIADLNALDDDHLGPDAFVEITITPK